jgi:hypothetical protein
MTTRKTAPVVDFVAQLREAINRLHFGQNRSLRDVARALNVPYPRVQTWARRHGIATKSRLDSLRDKYAGHGPNWTGGRTIFTPTRKGASPYAYVFRPDHPNANVRGYVFEHRWVMAEHLGRAIEPYEIVHHVDGNTLNNAVSNLEVRLRGGRHQPHGPLSVCPHCGADLLRR